MSRKTLLLILGSSFLGLAIIGTSLGLILSRPSGAEVSPLAPYIPSKVPIAFFIRLPVGEEAKAWSPLSDVLSEIPGFQLGLALIWSGPLLPGTTITLKQDVEPWLGNSLAVGLLRMPTGLFGGTTESESPLVLLAVEVRDGQAFRAFLEHLRQELEEAGTPLEESAFGRHTLFALPQQGLRFALRDDRVLLLSNELDTLKAVLEQEEKDSLADDADYRTLLQYLPSGGAFQAYLSSQYLQELLQKEAEAIGIPTKAGALTLAVEPEGLRMQFASLIDREAPAGESMEAFWMSPNSERALSFLPGESLFIFSGRVPALDVLWEGILSALRQIDSSAYRELQRSLEELSGKGLDVKRDLLSWMGREVGFFISLDQEEGIPLVEEVPLFMHLGLLVEVKDMGQARQGLEKVEALLGQAGLSFSDREIAGLTFRVFQVPEEPRLTPGYALVDNFLLLAPDEASFRSLTQARADPGDQASSAKEFQAVLRFLPGSRTELYFVNLEGLWKTLASVLPDETRQNARTWLPIAEHFRGLGIALAAGRPWDEAVTGVLFLHIVR